MLCFLVIENVKISCIIIINDYEKIGIEIKNFYRNLIVGIAMEIYKNLKVEKHHLNNHNIHG